jgi:hypothetical protein
MGRARAEAFSRRTATDTLGVAPVKLSATKLEVIDRLVRRDRTAVSSALLAVAGIGSREPMRRAALASVSKAAYQARAEGRSARGAASRSRGTSSARSAINVMLAGMR